MNSFKDNESWQKINHKTVRLDNNHILLSMSIIVDCSRLDITLLLVTREHTNTKLLHYECEQKIVDILDEWWRVMKWIMTGGEEITDKTILITLSIRNINYFTTKIMSRKGKFYRCHYCRWFPRRVRSTGIFALNSFHYHSERLVIIFIIIIKIIIIMITPILSSAIITLMSILYNTHTSSQISLLLYCCKYWILICFTEVYFAPCLLYVIHYMKYVIWMICSWFLC